MWKVLKGPSLANVPWNAQFAHIPDGISLRTGTRTPKICKYAISAYQLQTLTSVRWKYRLILAVDANFRMKNKERNVQDMPALGDGWAHFVPETPYMEHVQKRDFEERVRFPPFEYILV